MVVAGWQWVVVTVPAGFVAVKYYRFAGGTDTQESYGEGSHLKIPWDKMVLYQVRLQAGGHDFDVLTRDGLMMTVSIACRFRLSAPAVGWLHRNIGPDYMETLIATALGSLCTSNHFAQFDRRGLQRAASGDTGRDQARHQRSTSRNGQNRVSASEPARNASSTTS